MELIRAATLTVENLKRSQTAYCKWLDYKTVERGKVDEGLAVSWGAPKSAGQPYCILQPASKANTYLRLIEQPERADYKPLRTYGWAAIEICNQDTLAVNARMKQSPFEIIGPPKELDGMPAIFPMQIKGLDQEIAYLTEIRDNLPDYDLPRAGSLIDKLFILVMACSDMEKAGEWLEKHLLLTKGASMEIIYTMINAAFDLPETSKHAIATLQHERDVFLEIDHYPKGATPRAAHTGMLPPCAAIGTFIHPEFDEVMAVNKGLWITHPERRDGVIYKGKRAGTLRGPDGTLIELIEA
ncbi:MAG: VOC family protein [Alphaproteobacteria bacterium]